MFRIGASLFSPVRRRLEQLNNIVICRDKGVSGERELYLGSGEL